MQSKDNENTNNISLFLDNKSLHIKNNEPIHVISINDIKGKMVFYTRSGTKKINLTNLIPGIYIVNIIDYNNNKFTQKIMLD